MVCVDLGGEGQLSGHTNVCVGRRIGVRVLRVGAGETDCYAARPGGVDGACQGRVRGVERDVRVPACPCETCP